MENFNEGDLVICVKAFKERDYGFPVSVGAKFVVNEVYIGHCGQVGLDIGLPWKKRAGRSHCATCNAIVPERERPSYLASHFRKIPPPAKEYRIVEVAKELLIEAKRTTTLTEKIDV